MRWPLVHLPASFALAAAISAPGTVAFFDSKRNTAIGHGARLDLTLAGQGQAGPQGASVAPGTTGATGVARTLNLTNDASDWAQISN